MRREDKPIGTRHDVTQPRLRPGQAWVCGFAELGQSCRTGPTCDGRCGRTLANEQASTDGDSAQQARAGAQADTASEVDLPPCIPRRSLAVRRHALRLNLAILTAGWLMLCMALPSREKTFVPGDLSSKHAQILDNTLASERCSLCHPTSHALGDSQRGDAVLTGLLSSARRLVENDGRQDQLCMQCHQNHLPAAGNRDPHDLSPEDWRKLQATGETPWQRVSTRLVSLNTPDESSAAASMVEDNAQRLSKTSCAMCHNEHHGRGFDIKLISDNRCQACHQRQFESLASGHPEFKNFPVDRPRGLAFSHDQHAKDHFPKKNRDFDCKACHVSTRGADSNDLVTRSLSFEHACASCHDQPIRAGTVDGWAAIQLPSLEASDVSGASADAELALWPQAARYGYDGVVSPMMRGLLMADAAAADALQKLPASGKIVDISSISSARARVAQTLAAATRRLLQETARDGQAAWITRLQKVTQAHLGRELIESEQALIASMTAGLPPDLFRHIEMQWWAEHTPLAGTDLNVGKLTSATRSQQVTAPPTDPPTEDLLLDPAESKPTDSSSSGELSGNDELLIEPTKQSDAADLLGSAVPAPERAVSQAVKGATHLKSGGWYADHTTLSIRYMPTGHADSMLAAWSLWWSMMESHRPVLPHTEAQRISQRLNLTSTLTAVEVNQSLADMVPGKCTECHQLNRPLTKLVSQTAPYRIADSFQVPERDAASREFTKFRHTAHLTLPTLSDCRYCHQDKSAASAGLPIKHHPSMSEFAEMKISHCAACHRPGGANDRCVQCHNYHVTDFSTDSLFSGRDLTEGREGR